jgi:hypothetical protein
MIPKNKFIINKNFMLCYDRVVQSKEIVMSGEVEEFVTLSKEEVYDLLISIGLNSVNSSYSYRNEYKELVESFLSLPLSDVRGKWKHLDQNVKVKIIDKHDELIFSLLEEK